MEAQAWTAIGLLAATLMGALLYLGNRIDTMGARLDARIDALGGRIDGLESRTMARPSASIRFAAKLDDHLRRHVS